MTGVPPSIDAQIPATLEGAIADEPVGAADAYGEDRVFLYLKNAAQPDPDHETQVALLAAGGHPTITLSAEGPGDLGRIFPHSEFAVVVAGWALEMGQLHKGGAETGVLRQLVHDADADEPVPGRDFDFRELITAQADGDLATLADLGLPAERVRLRATDLQGSIDELTATLKGSV